MYSELFVSCLLQCFKRVKKNKHVKNYHTVHIAQFTNTTESKVGLVDLHCRLEDLIINGFRNLGIIRRLRSGSIYWR